SVAPRSERDRAARRARAAPDAELRGGEGQDCRGPNSEARGQGPRALDGLRSRPGHHDPRRDRLPARLVSSPGAPEGRGALADAEPAERAGAEAADLRRDPARRVHRPPAHGADAGQPLLRPRPPARELRGEPLSASAVGLEQTRPSRAVQLRDEARMMRIPALARWTAVSAALLLLLVGGLTLLRPTPARSQSPDVELNVRPGQMKRINIAVPDFNLVSGTDPQNWAKRLPGITAVDLNFSALFSVVSGMPPLPNGNAEVMRPRLAELAAAGAMQALQGLLTVRADRFEVEMR